MAGCGPGHRAMTVAGRPRAPVDRAARPARLDFQAIARAALAALPALLDRWAPGGLIRGAEWSGRNPKRTDHHPGSFKVNVRTGRWADFATGERGGDVVSLAAYLHDLPQAEAARRLAGMLGIGEDGHAAGHR